MEFPNIIISEPPFSYQGLCTASNALLVICTPGYTLKIPLPGAIYRHVRYSGSVMSQISSTLEVAATEFRIPLCVCVCVCVHVQVELTQTISCM